MSYIAFMSCTGNRNGMKVDCNLNMKVLEGDDTLEVHDIMLRRAKEAIGDDGAAVVTFFTILPATVGGVAFEARCKYYT